MTTWTGNVPAPQGCTSSAFPRAWPRARLLGRSLTARRKSSVWPTGYRSSPVWPMPTPASSAPDRSIDVPGAFQAPAPIPGRWFLGGAMSATGKALDWLRDDVLKGAVSSIDLVAEAAATPPGADGLVFLPYL